MVRRKLGTGSASQPEREEDNERGHASEKSLSACLSPPNDAATTTLKTSLSACLSPPKDHHRDDDAENKLSSFPLFPVRPRVIMSHQALACPACTVEQGAGATKADNCFLCGSPLGSAPAVDTHECDFYAQMHDDGKGDEADDTIHDFASAEEVPIVYQLNMLPEALVVANYGGGSEMSVR